MLNDVLATVAFALIVAGWTQRRRRERHVPLVLAGIALDFGMVVFLEATRHVVEEVAGVNEHLPFPAVRWAHIGTSTVAVALYVPTLVYGFRMVRGDASPATRHRHAVVSTAALLFRTVGFVCMWAVELMKTRT